MAGAELDQSVQAAKAAAKRDSRILRQKSPPTWISLPDFSTNRIPFVPRKEIQRHLHRSAGGVFSPRLDLFRRPDRTSRLFPRRIRGAPQVARRKNLRRSRRAFANSCQVQRRARCNSRSGCCVRVISTRSRHGSVLRCRTAHKAQCWGWSVFFRRRGVCLLAARGMSVAHLGATFASSGNGW